MNSKEQKKLVISNLRSRYSNALNVELAEKAKEEQMNQKVFSTTSHYKTKTDKSDMRVINYKYM